LENIGKIIGKVRFKSDECEDMGGRIRKYFAV